ncbi:MAG: magnesium and cobalt exporter, family [Anaerophaga sp.]|uniref:gliding motility-associated protein GldE n=1 Tax=Anaerophaga thermohalophila TaxID=177400 RepID=UPI000237CF95|nr:gliding motility-associated protein GldE [Anaerophaga thermohalophila]MDI3520906.1 magnesium and cobalt exporter, family [Anaerophaga sp.]MDK2840800.1 magnesium and cobalt exporter, family [Anaerophaga sp.]MDN5290047.1 magnesium and cobalt exporter, family [Anaerophaga sp.]
METDLFLSHIPVVVTNILFHPPTTSIIIAIIATLMLLAGSALVSGSEVAFFSLKPDDVNHLRTENSKRSQQVIKHLENPELLLATILILNNFINVGIVILSAYISSAVISFGENTTLKFIFDVVIITSIILFFGEIFPKVFAGQSPRKFASRMALPLRNAAKVLKPASMLLVRSSEYVKNKAAQKTKNLSLDDLSDALDLTGDEVFEEKQILKSIVTFGNINAGEVMTARVDVTDLEIKSDFNKVLSVIVESGYSRIPVFEETPDNVKGILYVKDLLPHLGKDNTFRWQNLIRPAYYVPETKRINDLLTEFQANKIHMAIVVDEYGGTSGIVTLEDILEEIVGEISDELDEDEDFFSVQPDGSLAFEGKTLLKDFFKITGIDENAFDDIKGEAETLAGLLLEVKGVIPEKHEIIEIGPYKFTILAADKRRIKKIKFAQKGKL